MIKYELKTKEQDSSTFNLALASLRIVFMGTPEFAVASLDALVKNGCQIAAVITAPDKPAGRGMQLTESAVKKYALANHLPVLQPEKLKNPAFLEQLSALKADLQIVVAFRMLPELVWNMPPKGTINLHGSLLPQYRGAAPINWAVINGEKETGVTTFKLKQEIDTGNILLQERFAIGEHETAGEVHDRMKEIGARLLVRTVIGIANQTLSESPQPDSGIAHPTSSSATQPTALHHAPKIFTETCRIDWSKALDGIYNLIRGLSPFPGAFTQLRGKMLKIYSCQKEYADHQLPVENRNFTEQLPGQEPLYQTDRKTFLKFACPEGFIQVKELQLEGKKRMKIEDFLRGYSFE